MICYYIDSLDNNTVFVDITKFQFDSIQEPVITMSEFRMSF